MSEANRFEERTREWNRVSESLFGDATEMDVLEAEAMLRSAGIEPETFKARLEERLHRRAQALESEGRPLPALWKQAFADLRGSTSPARNERELAGQARTAVRRVIEKVKSLRTHGWENQAPAFTLAYRQKTELSEQDKKLLHQVVHELLKRFAKDRE